MFSIPQKPENQQPNRPWRHRMERYKRRVADYLNRKTVSWNRQKQLIFLLITGGGYLGGLILIAISTPPAPKVEHLSVPAGLQPVPEQVMDTPPKKDGVFPDTISIIHP